jgi:hypothetical protein
LEAPLQRQSIAKNVTSAWIKQGMFGLVLPDLRNLSAEWNRQF